MTWTSYISRNIQKTLKVFFRKLGIKIYFHPYLFILSGLILTGLCGLGFLNFTFEDRVLYLWLPTSSDVFKNFETYINLFGDFESNMLLLIKENNNNNLMKTNKMNVLFDIFQISMNSTIISSKSSNIRWDFDKLCTRQYDTYPYCDSLESNVFALWLQQEPH